VSNWFGSLRFMASGNRRHAFLVQFQFNYLLIKLFSYAIEFDVLMCYYTNWSLNHTDPEGVKRL
jgi:hypothetical protein